MGARVDAAEREVTSIRRTLGQERERVRVLQTNAEVLFAPDMVRVDLAGQPAAPQAAARAFWSRRRGMTFAANALPPLPATKSYQVWVLTSGQPPISAGLIAPDPQGSALAHFVTPPDVPTPGGGRRHARTRRRRPTADRRQGPGRSRRELNRRLQATGCGLQAGVTGLTARSFL